MQAVTCATCSAVSEPSRFCPACGNERTSASGAADPLVGTTLAERYDIVEALGEGGMGRVYRAIQRGLDRAVAVKVIAPEHASSSEIAARFVAEARSLSKLNHPNIVRVFDFGRAQTRDGERTFLAMELLGGEDLRAAMVRAEPLPLVACADIVVQILSALAEAHQSGIAHRDIKPDNIRLTSRRDGRHRVKLIDFGIARDAAGVGVTRSGLVVGTPEYMSPEAVSGVADGPDSDLYAVGVVLFELLTRRALFQGTPAEVMRKQLSAPRPDPREQSLRPLPDALVEVVSRAISIEPERRYPSAQAFAQAILRAGVGAGWVSRTGAAFPTLRPPPTAPATEPLLPSPARSSLHRVSPVLPLLDREEALQRLRTALDLAPATALALVGPHGTGRTRLLAEAASHARSTGRTVVRVQCEPAPRNEIGFGLLRGLLRELLGCHDDGRALELGARGAGESATLGLRLVFAGEMPEFFGPEDVREVASAALLHALSAAARGAGRAGLAVLVDDLDLADLPSRRAVVDALSQPTMPAGVVLVATGVKLQLGADVPRVSIGPLSPERVRECFGDRAPAFALEALAVERIGRGFAMPHAAPGRSFLALMSEIAIGDLDHRQRRVLQALAVTGAITLEDLERVFDAATDVSLRADLRGLVEALEAKGFARFFADPSRGGALFVHLRHAVDAEVALGQLHGAALSDLHARRRAQLVRPQELELAAHHAIHARLDFDAFVTTEGCARLRARRGDLTAAADALWAGVRAGRSLFAQGEVSEAESAFVIFGPRLAETLIELGRLNDARALLEELLELTRPVGLTYAVVLEALARLSEREGDPRRARARRDAALEIAERNGDWLLCYRLRRAMVERVPPWDPSSRPPGAPRSRSGRRARVTTRTDADLPKTRANGR